MSSALNEISGKIAINSARWNIPSESDEKKEK